MILSAPQLIIAGLIKWQSPSTNMASNLLIHLMHYPPLKIITLFSLLSLVSGQQEPASETSQFQPLANDKISVNVNQSTGLCAGPKAIPNHTLFNLTSFFHTPWLDADGFCTYPPTIHLEDHPAQECRSTPSGILQELLYICELAVGKRLERSYQEMQLPFCSDYSVQRVFGGLDECIRSGNMSVCRSCMQNIYQIDQHVKHVYCHFVKDVLARFDCGEESRFSICSDCNQCQAAYRQWLCAMMIPFRMGDYIIRPCTTFCTRVEQKCPYLTPDDKVIYAGEPMFFCKDPDIPELYSAYAQPPHCYQPCHLNDTLEPVEACHDHQLLMENLARYYNMSTQKLSVSSRISSAAPVSLLTSVILAILVV